MACLACPAVVTPDGEPLPHVLLSTAATNTVYSKGKLISSSLGDIVHMAAGMDHVLVVNSEGAFNPKPLFISLNRRSSHSELDRIGSHMTLPQCYSLAQVGCTHLEITAVGSWATLEAGRPWSLLLRIRRSCALRAAR
jgi:hypothetical protein